MNAEELELLREAILRVLAANKTPFGVPIEAVRLRVYHLGFSVDRDQLLPELDYLVDKGLVALKDKTISPEVRAWRITAAGRDYLAALNR